MFRIGLESAFSWHLFNIAQWLMSLCLLPKDLLKYIETGNPLVSNTSCLCRLFSICSHRWYDYRLCVQFSVLMFAYGIIDNHIKAMCKHGTWLNSPFLKWHSAYVSILWERNRNGREQRGRRQRIKIIKKRLSKSCLKGTFTVL